ncbi:YtxH domain-containing protein [Mucilaginibacter aquaedulcis]|uniref:YtxH domain-containing protein n=1 Tax=Mucilaginibacter aquaedulcis TaxID=1187081 RepID=UPI0025B43976|nr:YtxH domain-containing protein [Mucilaginibacter aquaedulcis]MDN3551617.1 YtxH domain-containing protein [Mucilaginibacter aquaedulcis]
MSTIKTFLLGAATAYAVYFITRKRVDDTSILDDLLDNPSLFLNKAKDYAMAEVMKTIKEKLN